MASSVPSEKSKKYDRQLRLWGDHGQSLLESAHVCLLNATATGTELLKNLILPGIGSFTIVDSNYVSVCDLGVNFFVASEDVGKSRSQVAMTLLQEMNNDVKGNFIDDSFESVLSSDPNFFSQFTVVIASDLSESNILKISELLWKSCIPLVVARSYGLTGYIRIATPSHEVYESHPDNFHDDLRLDCPFQELLEYMDGIDLSSVDATLRGNVPYLVILFKVLQKWKAKYANKFPSSYKEKKQFKMFIQQEMGVDDTLNEEDNIEEAIKNVNHKLVETKIPSDVLEILDDHMCRNISPNSSTFWVIARAIRDFVHNEGDGHLPLRGSIPDMISSSDMYVQLQRVYQHRANLDVDAVHSHVQHILNNIGRKENFVSKKTVKEFCRNSAFLKYIRFRSISEEYTNMECKELKSLLENPNDDSVYYILLRAAEKYYTRYQCYPGEKPDAFDSDVSQMKAIVVEFLFNNGLSCNISDDHITEFCRYGGREIHSVAAFIGGVASQEIIKLITHQFLPFNNTLIYHAGSSKTITLNL